jgi:fatty acid desaturase
MLSISFPTSDALDGATSWVASFTSTNSLHEVVINGFRALQVFAITQETELMSNDLTWRGVGHGMLVLAAIWWLWTGYAWLTNSLEPEEGIVRAGMFAAMVAMFLVALAVPRAFGAQAVLFGVAYLVVRMIVKGAFIPIGGMTSRFSHRPFGLPRTRGRAQETSRHPGRERRNRAIVDRPHSPGGPPHDLIPSAAIRRRTTGSGVA